METFVLVIANSCVHKCPRDFRVVRCTWWNQVIFLAGIYGFCTFVCGVCGTCFWFHREEILMAEKSRKRFDRQRRQREEVSLIATTLN